MTTGRNEHGFQLCQRQFVQVFFGLFHDICQSGVILVLALVNVENLDELVNGLLSTLLDTQK